MNPHWSDWLFWIGGWAFAGGGAILLIWAIRGDRSRGRRRCRKCWYDMVAAEPVEGVWTCPECGKRATREKLLLRPRRRWRLAIVAWVPLVAAYPAYSGPTIRQNGWVSAVPSSVLVFIAPIEQADIRDQRSFFTGLTLFGIFPRSPLLKELIARASDRKLARWQSQMLLDRVIAAEPAFLRGSLLLRDPWPVGYPLVVEPILFQAELFGGPDWMLRVRARGGSKWLVRTPHVKRWIAPDSRGDSDLGTFDAGTIDLECEILVGVSYIEVGQGLFEIDRSEAKVAWRGSLGTIQIAGTPEDVIEAIKTRQSTNAVESLLVGVASGPDDRPWLIMRDTSGHIGASGDGDWGIGFRAELLIGGEPVASVSAVYPMTPPNMMAHSLSLYHAFEMDWIANPLDFSAVQDLSIRFVDDPGRAITDLTRTVFWRGELEMDIEDVSQAWGTQRAIEYAKSWTERP